MKIDKLDQLIDEAFSAPDAKPSRLKYGKFKNLLSMIIVSSL